jgi:hypothetical protein
MAIATLVDWDTDDNDEDQACLTVNGIARGRTGTGPSGVPSTDNFAKSTGDSTWWSDLGAGPYTCELIVGEQVVRNKGAADGTTFYSSSQFQSIALPSTVTIATGATASRLVVVGDGTMSGHLADLLPFSAVSGAAATRVRKAYPGQVTAHVAPQFTWQSIQLWGAGDETKLARYLFDRSNEGSPLARSYFMLLGFGDWAAALQTLAAGLVIYGNFLDALHALDPAGTVYIAAPVQTAFYGTTNALGETLGQYATGINNLAGARPWLNVVNVTVPNVITFIGSPGAEFNPSQPAGAQALADNIKVALGY